MIALDKIKAIAQNIMDENQDWVNDSHSALEHDNTILKTKLSLSLTNQEHAGIVSGLNQLISRLKNDDSELAYSKLEYENTILKTKLSLCLTNSEQVLKELREINKN